MQLLRIFFIIILLLDIAVTTLARFKYKLIGNFKFILYITITSLIILDSLKGVIACWSN